MRLGCFAVGLFFLFSGVVFGTTITTTLDTTPPPADPAYTATTGLQTGRLNRFSPASNCDAPEANPGLFVATGSRRYDAYVFTPSTSQCFAVTLTGGANTMYVAAYNASGFVPANPSTNYLADPGVSPTNSTVVYFFSAVAGQPFTLVVSEVDVGGGVGTGYTLTVNRVATHIVDTVLDATPPPVTPAYDSVTGFQSGRLTRNGIMSTCVSPKVNPGLQTAAGSRRYDSYRFTASRSGCVTVTLISPSTALFVAAYGSGGFVPATPDLSYLADPGLSQPRSIFTFEVVAGQRFTIVVHEVENGGGQGTNYTLRVAEAGSLTPFDFDGDSRTDIGIFRPASGQWWLRRSMTESIVVATFGVSSDRIVPADFSGDGRADIAVWRPSTGTWFILRSENSSFFAFPFGSDGDIPRPADFDGDGKADAAVFRPSNSTWYIRRSIDGGTTFETFGTAGDLPVNADYNGDGLSDVAIFRPSVGQWWIKRSAAGVLVLTFGVSTDTPTPGDFTGDGRADIALWRPATGEWFVLRSEDLSFFSFPFGTVFDVPAPGDYDGDGRFDAAVFRSGTWYIQNSNGGITIIPFGIGTDRPIPHAFVP